MSTTFLGSSNNITTSQIDLINNIYGNLKNIEKLSNEITEYEKDKLNSLFGKIELMFNFFDENKERIQLIKSFSIYNMPNVLISQDSNLDFDLHKNSNVSNISISADYIKSALPNLSVSYNSSNNKISINTGLMTNSYKYSIIKINIGYIVNGKAQNQIKQITVINQSLNDEFTLKRETKTGELLSYKDIIDSFISISFIYNRDDSSKIERKIVISGFKRSSIKINKIINLTDKADVNLGANGYIDVDLSFSEGRYSGEYDYSPLGLINNKVYLIVFGDRFSIIVNYSENSSYQYSSTNLSKIPNWK